MKSDRRSCLLILGVCVLWSASLGGNAQDSKKPPAMDHSNEAYVIEESTNRYSFENDGTGTRDETVRVRIQSDAGVEHFGVLTLSYAKATQTAQIAYARVRKPDGSVIPTPLDEVQDIPAEVTREAPFYSDLREMQLPVKGMSIGDVLEYQFHSTFKSLIPGQFWMAATFEHDAVILDCALEVSVPRERAVKFSSPGLAPTIAEQGQRRIYTWKRSNLEVQQEPKSRLMNMSIHGAFPAPDVELTSFQSWEEIGRWYGGLQQDRIVPSPEIRAKAAELTRNAVDDNARIQAIYKYVSTEYRYIGVAFGIGRYQPHSAAEVLSNHYGDCKDKHTLLASLLAAAGIPAYAALINYSQLRDPEVPSPAQFNHVITVVPRGQDFLWLDATSEVGPLGYLVPQLRNKQAMVIFPDKAADFVTTPADPPFAELWTFKISAKLDESGTLEGKIEQSLRGDVEVIWRSALRRLPRSQWKDAIQGFSYATGFAGEVSDVIASAPEATETPLHFSYTYRRKDYPDWENHRITMPAPTVFAPPFEEEGKLPQRLWLGAPGKFEFESRVEVPKGYEPYLPAKKDLNEEFAEYHATYAVQNGVLVAHFQIMVKTPEVSGSRVNDYKAMVEKVTKDRNQFIPLTSSSTSSPVESLGALLQQVWELPDSTNSGARQSGDDARAALARRSLQDALPSLQRAVAQDPKFTRAWILMGQLYLFTARQNDAIDAFRHAVDVDPQQVLPNKVLAFGLAHAGRRTESIQVWQDLAKIAPDDRDIPSTLGGLLLAEKRFGDAVPYLEKAVKMYPDNTGAQFALATAYLNTAQDEKATEIFAREVQSNPDAETRNDVAYALANAGKRLDDALRYAQEAVRVEEDASSKVQLSKSMAEDATLVGEDLKPTRLLAAYWDTLGWVYYRQNNLKQAEEYLYAAWLLRQGPTIGYHLAQAYEKQQRTQEAAHMYRLVANDILESRGEEDRDAVAEAKRRAPPETHRLAGRAVAYDNPTEELSRDRSASLPKLAGSAGADFFLSFAPAAKPADATQSHSLTNEAVVEDTLFVSGSDVLRSAGEVLRRAHFKVVFPEGSSGRLVRRGFLSCSSFSGCTFVLIPIE